MKLNRKLVLILALVLSVAMATTGTLAYLTDRDSEANVFTIGNVDIKLNETFEQGETLIPGVNIEKEPTITNIGKNDAWVWATIAIPAVLDSDASSDNVIHFNMSAASVAAGQWTWWGKNDDGARADWNKDYGVKYNDVDYNVFTVLYQTALKPGETTATPVIYKTYMDNHIDIDPEGNLNHVLNGKVEPIDWNINKNGMPVIYVSAYAMQKDQFATVWDAYEAYNTQWDADSNNVNDEDFEWAAAGTLVATAEELTAALEAGESVALTADIDMNGTRLDIPTGKKATINLNGHKLTSKDGGGQNTMAIYVNDGATFTLDDTVGTGELIASCYGVYVKKDATFVMDGGTITVSGNGVYDMGVITWNGKFVMNAGTINSQYGVWTINYYQGGNPNEVTIKEGCTLNSTSGIDVDVVDAPDTILNVPATLKVNMPE